MADVEEQLPQVDQPPSFVTVEFDRDTGVELEPTSEEPRDRNATELDHVYQSPIQSECGKDVQRSLQELDNVYQSSVQSESGKEAQRSFKELDQREPTLAEPRDRSAAELDHVHGLGTVCCSFVKFAPPRQ